MLDLNRNPVRRTLPLLTRVLIIDPNLMTSKLIAEIIKGIGGRNVNLAADEKQATSVATQWDPTLIFVEHRGPDLNGEEFVRTLRRSRLHCRRAPVIMVANEATASVIKGARDSGVHEFIRKPFATGDVTKRVAAIASRPRDWIEAVGYVGPDRRRFNSAEYAGDRKRSGEAASTPAEIKDRCMRIVASALAQFDSDPMQAIRALREQAGQLKTVAAKIGDSTLATAATILEGAVSGGTATRALLTPIVERVLALRDPEQTDRPPA